MTSAGASSELPATPTHKSASNRTATVALIAAIIGFVVTKIPAFGAIAGSPEEVAALILGIIGAVSAFRSGTGKAKAIVAIIVAVATFAGLPFGEGTVW
jgi:hypothetical protein